MTTHLLDGKAIATRLLDKAKADIAALARAPGLAAILVGDDPASELYVRLKKKACLTAGVKFERHELAANAGQAALLALIDCLNCRCDIDAILLQLPLPADAGYDADAAVLAIDPSKDVDGFHPSNLARLKKGEPAVISPLVAGIMELLRSANADWHGQRALVIANSPVFFEPLEVTLRTEGMEPEYCSPDAPDLLERARAADAVIVAVGRPGFLKGNMLKPGATVIDVGTNRLEREGKTTTVGDADPSVSEVAAHLSPVPGGVGPMTVAMVVRNAIELAKLRQ